MKKEIVILGCMLLLLTGCSIEKFGGKNSNTNANNSNTSVGNSSISNSNTSVGNSSISNSNTSVSNSNVPASNLNSNNSNSNVVNKNYAGTYKGKIVFDKEDPLGYIAFTLKIDKNNNCTFTRIPMGSDGSMVYAGTCSYTKNEIILNATKSTIQGATKKINEKLKFTIKSSTTFTYKDYELVTLKKQAAKSYAGTYTGKIVFDKEDPLGYIAFTLKIDKNNKCTFTRIPMGSDGSMVYSGTCSYASKTITLNATKLTLPGSTKKTNEKLKFTIKSSTTFTYKDYELVTLKKK